MSKKRRPALHVTRRPEKLVSDDRRVIARFLETDGPEQARPILERVLSLDEDAVRRALDETVTLFGARHRDWEEIMRSHYERVRPLIGDAGELSPSRQLLIGAYFTLEYSIESAALFNPAIVPHPNQRDLPEGAVRFLVSLRATGDGHVSSIVFRRGIIDKDGDLHFDAPPRFAHTGQVRPDKLYDKALFERRLLEIGGTAEVAEQLLTPLPERFTRAQLDDRLAAFVDRAEREPAFAAVVRDMRWLCEANYTLQFPADTRPGEIVILPATVVETQGMEDLRLVRFMEDDGRCVYYGTYTAWDGRRRMPMLLETADFQTFHVSTLNGPHARDKGMAMFPRRINGRYYCVGRGDGENLFLLQSENVHFWYEGRVLEVPREPWELTRIGNCGSPVETDAGFILLTHGVGPVRRYCIGAMLLDKDDPSRVLGRLREPLIVPDENERDGYVPNVVYSCGAMVHDGVLTIPYAMSTVATTFATVPVRELVDRLIAEGP